MVSWYYLVSWYFSWYSIVRHFYGIVTTLHWRALARSWHWRALARSWHWRALARSWHWRPRHSLIDDQQSQRHVSLRQQACHTLCRQACYTLGSRGWRHQSPVTGRPGGAADSGDYLPRTAGLGEPQTAATMFRERQVWGSRERRVWVSRRRRRQPSANGGHGWAADSIFRLWSCLL